MARVRALIPVILRFDHVSGGLCFRLPGKLLDSLSYLRLYIPALRMGMDQVLTVLAVRSSTEVDWENIATSNVLVWDNFMSWEELSVEEESVEVRKRARSIFCSYASVTSVAVHVLFRAGKELVGINVIRRNSDEYLALAPNSVPASGISLDSCFEQNLLCAQTAHSVEVRQASLSASRELLDEVGCAVLVSEKNYVDLV